MPYEDLMRKNLEIKEKIDELNKKFQTFDQLHRMQKKRLINFEDELGQINAELKAIERRITKPNKFSLLNIFKR